MIRGTLFGFFVDIIESIAKSEKWEIKWVYNDWQKCLELLENDSIDLMPDYITTIRYVKSGIADGVIVSRFYFLLY